MDSRNDGIKIVGKEADINTLNSTVDVEVVPDADVKPEEVLVVNPNNLRYAAQVAKKYADGMNEFSPEKIAASVPTDIEVDKESRAYHDWKKMMDDISRKVSGTFSAVNYQMIDQFARGGEEKVDEVGEFRPIDIDNLDNVSEDVLSEVSEMDEMFLEQKDNNSYSTKEFRR